MLLKRNHENVLLKTQEVSLYSSNESCLLIVMSGSEV